MNFFYILILFIWEKNLMILIKNLGWEMFYMIIIKLYDKVIVFSVYV